MTEVEQKIHDAIREITRLHNSICNNLDEEHDFMQSITTLTTMLAKAIGRRVIKGTNNEGTNNE